MVFIATPVPEPSIMLLLASGVPILVIHRSDGTPEIMAEKLDPKETLTLEELAVSHMWETAALVKILEHKGIITEQEIIDTIKELREALRRQRQLLSLSPNPTCPQRKKISSLTILGSMQIGVGK